MALGQEQGFRRFAKLGPKRAVMDKARFKMAFGKIVGHHRLRSNFDGSVYRTRSFVKTEYCTLYRNIDKKGAPKFGFTYFTL
jgi:hypothetical protein